jgi:predicted nucleotidyltransferase
MLTDDDLRRIADRIVRGLAPVAVGTFGSYAVGTASARSDVDVFVIAESTDRATVRSRAVRRLLFGVLHPLDIHVFTPAEFEDEAYEYLSFAWVIVRQARLYYHSERAPQAVPSLFARSGLVLEDHEG